MISLENREKSRAEILEFKTSYKRLSSALGRGEELPVLPANVAGSVMHIKDVETKLRAIKALLDTKQKDYESKLLEAAPHSLSHYIEFLYPNESPAPFQEKLIEVLEDVEAGRKTRVMVSLPPGSGKTSIISRRFASWYYGRNPDNTVLLVGHTQLFSESKLGREVRAIIEKEKYKRVFPNRFLERRVNSVKEFKFEGFEGLVISKGVEASISGIRVSLVLLDDLFGCRADAYSPTIQQKIWNWYVTDILSRGDDPDMPIVLVGTRWHVDDLLGQLERRHLDNPEQENWCILNFPVVIEDANDLTNDITGRKIGETLWEKKFPPKFIKQRQIDMAANDFSAQYLGKPLAKKGAIVEQSWLSKRFDALPEVKEKTIVIDCASKTTTHSNYTAILSFVEGLDGQHYLANVIRDRLTYPAFCKAVAQEVARFDPNVLLIEDTSSGTAFYQDRGRDFSCPIIPISPGRRSKQEKFYKAANMLESGLFVFPRNAPWLQTLFRELLSFPLGTDDMVDCFSMYADRKQKQRGGKRGFVKVSGW